MDGLLGNEARILLKKLSALLAAKWERPYSEVIKASLREANS
jgi:hypothetical protein